MKYIVETALLSHGLTSISDDELIKVFPAEAVLLWLEDGIITFGNIERFISFRQKSNTFTRANKSQLVEAIENKESKVLTASACLWVAKERNVPIVVTAGMGGIEKLNVSEDLEALEEFQGVLIATSPKDIVDIEKTIAWFLERNIPVEGKNTDITNGFMFIGKPVSISRKYSGDIRGPKLLLNKIDENKRFLHSEIIEEQKKAGEEAKKAGKMFHPMANAYLDRKTNGLSSKRQLEALIENITWAEEICKDIKNR